MRILAVSDDGIASPGLAALARALAPRAEVWAAAPVRNQSGRSAALTIHEPLRAAPARVDGVPRGRAFAVAGTPADAVRLAVLHLLPSPPDLVVCGVNEGWNLGPNIFRSGTVMAALEAVLLGRPALALSAPGGDPAGWRSVERRAAAILPRLLAEIRAVELWNVNLPAVRPRGLRRTRPAPPWPDAGYEPARRENRTRLFRLRPEIAPASGPRGTDLDAVRRGYVSVTRLYPGFISALR